MDKKINRQGVFKLEMFLIFFILSIKIIFMKQ